MFIITSNAELAALADEIGEFSFPQSLNIRNLMPCAIVDSWIDLYLDSNLRENGKISGEFYFPTFGHLMKFATDMQAVAKRSGFESAVEISKVSSSQSAQEESALAQAEHAPKANKPRRKSPGNSAAPEMPQGDLE